VKSSPGLYGVLDNVEAEEKLRKIIVGMRDRRFASVWKKKVRQLARRKREKMSKV
jgi:hypothetical protein